VFTRGGDLGFIEHCTRNLFRGMAGCLEEKFGKEALVSLQGYPELRAYPDNVARYASLAGGKSIFRPESVELRLDLVVMTTADYRDLLRRAEKGDERRDAQVASTAKALGRSEEKARIKGKLTKVVEGLVEG
jgi:hypothetical protein